jgi:nicotinate dehydrogenase subunit B
MLVGAVLRPPAFGATLDSVDVAAASAMPGVVAVADDDFVGVAAPDLAAATRAIEAIDASWTQRPQPSESDLVDHLRRHPVEAAGWEGGVDDATGNVDSALARAAHRLEATYTAAYIAHVPLETRVATAEWDDRGRLTVWTGTQRPFGVRADLAEALGVGEEAVRVIVPDTGGGWGGKHTGEAALEAARLARAAGRPVMVRWTREEEMTWGYFRPFAVIDVRAGIDPDGTLDAWAFTNTNSGSNAIGTPYRVRNRRIRYQPADSPLRIGSYRGLAATANTFARETAMDELAIACGADPLEFRLRHLDDERLATVLRTAAEQAGWHAATHGPGAADGHGWGIAASVEKGGRVATAAEVRVGRDRHLEIVRLISAFECGLIVNPENLRNQIEGAAAMGLGGALFEAVHFGNGRILTPTIKEYRVPRMTDIPPIEVVLVDRPDLPSAGAGETPIIAIGPAIGNAIHAATGTRLRSMPLAPDGIVVADAQVRSEVLVRSRQPQRP